MMGNKILYLLCSDVAKPLSVSSFLLKNRFITYYTVYLVLNFYNEINKLCVITGHNTCY